MSLDRHLPIGFALRTSGVFVSSVAVGDVPSKPADLGSDGREGVITIKGDAELAAERLQRDGISIILIVEIRQLRTSRSGPRAITARAEQTLRD